MADCEQCAALQRQNDILANDRDGYVQLLTDNNNKLRAEVDNLKRMVIAQEKLLRSKDAEIERLMSVVERVYQSSAQKHIIELTRAAIRQEMRDE